MQNEEIIHGYTTIDLNSYPDGMPIISNPGYLGGEEYPTLILRPKTLSSFVSAMFYCDAMEERGHPINNLILPFIPGSRQDRLNPTGDYLFTLKSVAQMINQRNFDRVIVVDPHSLVAPALIDRCVVYEMRSFFLNWYTTWNGTVVENPWDAVIAPDAGAAKRAFDAATALGVGFLQAEKHRDVSTGKLSGFACNGIEPDKHYLIVDDICDGGGTFEGLGQVIRSQGATADLFVTHGIFSKGTESLKQIFGTVYTTDTTLFPDTKIHNIGVVNIVEGLRELCTE